MKKIIPVLLLCCVHYFVSAQSVMQKAASANVSSVSTGSSGNTPTHTVSTSNSNSNSNSNYQVKTATPTYNVNTSNAVPNQYVPNNQVYITSGRSHFQTVQSKPVAEKIAIVSDLNPVITKVLFPFQKATKKIAIKNTNVLFSTPGDSSTVFVPNSKAPVLVNVVHQKSGSPATVKTEYIYPKNKLYRYRCLYGKIDDYRLGWYGIHVAAFKNLDYCKTVIRYMKSRYKLDVYLFEDWTSVNMRYHLVLGKYRRYFVAENMLSYIKKEMPTAFVVNWNRYAEMILFK